jgi:hypothetical protein
MLSTVSPAILVTALPAVDSATLVAVLKTVDSVEVIGFMIGENYKL